MKRQLIAIDTEYNANEDLGTINEVYCIAACDENNNRFTKWFNDQHDVNILEEIKSTFNIENPMFICYAFEKAERKALLHLGVDLRKYDFIDSYLIEKFLMTPVQGTLKKGTLELVETCKRYKLTERNAEQKKLMRWYCCQGTVKGHEKEIVDYCFDDVRDLIPLFKMQLEKYRHAAKFALNVHRNEPLRKRFNPNSERYPDLYDNESFYNIFTLHCEFLKGFGEIADRGIPVNVDRLQHLKNRAQIMKKSLEDDLMAKYDDNLFNVDRKNHRSKSALVTQELLKKTMTPAQLEIYPKTKSGQLSTKSDDLKEFFKYTEGFGHDLYIYNKLVSSLRMLKDCDLAWISESHIKYESLKPWGAKTGRCAPSTSKFIWGWDKALYPIIQPTNDDTWLVELDFNSEETFLQAAMCADVVCYEAYCSKDIYFYFLHRFGEIPDNDWQNLSVDELKDKYGHLRKPFKGVLLGSSYGLGAKKLAARANLTLDQAKERLKQINDSMKATTDFKHQVYEACNELDYLSTDDFALAKLPLRNDEIYTTMKNFSFQSMGATILHWVVRELYKNPDKYRAKPFSTVHDAIWFECKKGDFEAIVQIRELMRNYANHYSRAPHGWSIKIGSPEIVEKGDWFVGEKEKLKMFTEAWTDDLDERQKIIDQYNQQQLRNADYVKQYERLLPPDK